MSNPRDTADQTPEVSYRNLVQMPPVRVPPVGREPFFRRHGLDGPRCLLYQILDRGSAVIHV